MSTSSGRFVWYELTTSDIEAAEAFYGKVLGWSFRDAGMPDMAYGLASAGQREVAGIMTPPKGCEHIPPNWIGYVATADVDGTARKIADQGGVIHKQPTDIPGVGRFAIVADPDKAVFALFKALDGREAPPAEPMSPGNVGWHELITDDPKAAFAFYEGQFGWTRGEAIDMGPEYGIYQLIDQGGRSFGGMMKRPPAIPLSHWGFYFSVADIDESGEMVTSGGGAILNGPQQVPGGAWILQCTDPQGAHFNLVGPRR